MRLPSARGFVVSFGLATAALWLTAAAAEAQGPVPSVSVPKVPAAAAIATAKGAAPPVTAPVPPVKAVVTQAKSTAASSVNSSVNSVNNVVKTLPAPTQAPRPTKQSPVAPVVNHAEQVVKQATAPVQAVVQSVAPAPVTETVNAVEPTINAAATPVDPVDNTVQPSVVDTQPAMAATTLPVTEAPTGVETTAEPQGTPVNVRAAAPHALHVVDDGAALDPPVVSTEPEPTAVAESEAPVEPSTPTSVAPISVTPVLEELLDIHDALLPQVAAVSTTAAALELTSSTSTSTSAAEEQISAPQTAITSGQLLRSISQFSIDLTPSNESSQDLPRVPLSPEAGGMPISVPATAPGAGTGPPGAAQPPADHFNLTVTWQALQQLARLQPVSIALSNLAPPG